MADNCDRFTSGVRFKVIVNVIVLGLVTCFGLIGNFLCLCALRHRYHACTLLILQALSVADMFYLVGGIFSRFAPTLEREALMSAAPQVLNVIRPYSIAVAAAAQTMTSYVVVLVTIDRFISICMPLKVRAIMNGTQRAQDVGTTSKCS